jgi:hypothetical protein
MVVLNSEFTLLTVVIAVLLFGTLLGALWLGQRISRNRAARLGETPASSGAVGASIFALLGLLIAFTFSGAASRFDERRDVIVQEGNAIGTAYLRLDMLDPTVATPLRGLFRRYTDARLSAYRAKTLAEMRSEQARAAELQSQLWTEVSKAAIQAGSPVPQVLLPAVNDMIDVATLHDAAVEKHPPGAIYWVLALMSVLAALLAGIELSPTQPVWVLKIIFAATISLTFWLTLDIEHPRLGVIRVTDTDHFLIDLRKSMK